MLHPIGRAALKLMLVCPLVGLASCATMTTSRSHHVPIDSVPHGAIVSYNGANVGVTPCTVTMRSKCTVLVLKRDGYHDQFVQIGTSTNGWIFGNLLLGGVAGLAVDGISGAGSKISEEPCWVELTPLSEPRPGPWLRPRRRESYADEDSGWIPEGKTEPIGHKPYVHQPTKASPWDEKSGQHPLDLLAAKAAPVPPREGH